MKENDANGRKTGWLRRLFGAGFRKKMTETATKTGKESYEASGKPVDAAKGITEAAKDTDEIGVFRNGWRETRR